MGPWIKEVGTLRSGLEFQVIEDGFVLESFQDINDAEAFLNTYINAAVQSLLIQKGLTV